MISKYSIAVLPFVNMSSDRENEYFSDGVTEEIINALSKIEGLHVTSRTSSFAFKSQSIDIREIGKKLNVALILEGSIRKSENTIRITAQLVQVNNGYHLWSDTWDRKLQNIFIVQDEIAAIIAEKINKNIRFEVSSSEHILENTEALDWYLKGNYYLNKWDFNERDTIINCYEKAIELDPKLIKAYIGLSHVYTWLGSTGYVDPRDAHIKVEDCIQKVIELDKNVPEVYIVIAGKNFWIEWDLPLAMTNINRALELKPSSAEALQYKGMILAAMGRVEEALDHLFQADRLNPYSNQINSGIGMIYNWTNENIKALEYIQKNIQICPYWHAQYIDHLEVLCKMKRYDEAWKTIEMIDRDPHSPLSAAQMKAYYYACKGEVKDALKQVTIMDEEQEKAATLASPDDHFYAQIYLLLNEQEKALDYLEHGLAHGATPFLFIKIQSYWDALRIHPRYQQAVKKIKFEDAKVRPDLKEKKYKKTNITKKQAQILKKVLHELMINDKPYLHPTLSLSDIAESVNISTHQLSLLLNEFIGKNFYDYVNEYRLNHFLENYNSPSYKNFTLLALAYECGFNSKTTFNGYFKKALGTTPSEYFKSKYGL